MSDHPLDPFILSLADSLYANHIRIFFIICFFFAFVGFVYFWFSAIRIWFLGFRDALKNKRGIFWGNDFSNPFVQRFVKTIFKGFLVWLIAGWPLLFVLTGLASTDAFNTLLGYDAISQDNDRSYSAALGRKNSSIRAI